MCKTKAEGGPCAAHSRQGLAKAIAGGDNKRIAAAQLEFELTSGGIKELRAQGKDFQADLRQAERDEITAGAIRALGNTDKDSRRSVARRIRNTQQAERGRDIARGVIELRLAQGIPLFYLPARLAADDKWVDKHVDQPRDRENARAWNESARLAEEDRERREATHDVTYAEYREQIKKNEDKKPVIANGIPM